MAIYDLEEQEQIDALKAFWRDYGRLVIAAAVAFVVGVGGTQGWKHYKRTQVQEASLKFVELEQAVAAIVESAFQSAGQRCSALRCLYVQEDIAEPYHVPFGLRS